MADNTMVGPDAASPGTLRKRLRRRGWLLAGAAAVLVVLAATDLVSWAGAAIIAIGAAAAFVLAPGEQAGPAAAPATGPAIRLLPGTRRIAQSLPNAAFILAADGTVEYANDKAVQTFSLRAGESLPFRLRYPDLLAGFDRAARGEGPQQVQFSERIPTERWFSAWFAPLDEAGATPRTILLLVEDLSAARALERMRVDFVANASHELRTPLASLTGFIETLLGAARDDPQARARFLAIMHEQATRMSRLIDDLLSLSRIELKAHVPPRDRIDLAALLRHVVDTMSPRAADLSVRVETEIPPGRLMVTGDRDELVQVFDNLVENACKYGGAGGRVIVRLDMPEGRGQATASVIDFGPGIAPEHVPRLTERFYRVDGDDRSKHRGTGLGLAIVKHIATRHRARLQIESEPGKGSRFSVTFPDAETQPAVASVTIGANPDDLPVTP